MSKRIAVVTTNRSEYGLLKNLIMKLQKCSEFDTDVLVSGAHLEARWGFTIEEIKRDKIENLKKIEIFNDENRNDISMVMAEALKKFNALFVEIPYDMLVVLGDRYETLAICIAAVNNRIPIAHLHGGEISEGALDDYYRHCITKLSYLHFTSLPQYRDRVIQLGESPERVYYVGAPGVENILQTPLLSKEELEKSIEFKLDNPYALVTYHPVSGEDNTFAEQLRELLAAMEERNDLSYIVTYANPDAGGEVINEMLEQFVRDKDNILLVKSLGCVRYLSALKYAEMAIGNSSSGILEVPSFHIPTVNIGERQRGRIHADTVIDCGVGKDEIVAAMKKAEKLKKEGTILEMKNPYEKNGTTDQIVNVIKSELEKGINIQKRFYDQ